MNISQSDVDRVRLENAINNLGPMARTKLPGQTGERIIVLVVDEVVRLRKALAQTAAEAKALYEDLQSTKARLMTHELMSAEINASLHYEQNKTFWQRLQDLVK